MCGSKLLNTCRRTTQPNTQQPMCAYNKSIQKISRHLSNENKIQQWRFREKKTKAFQKNKDLKEKSKKFFKKKSLYEVKSFKKKKALKEKIRM